jgi:hypothetical protein
MGQYQAIAVLGVHREDLTVHPLVTKLPLCHGPSGQITYLHLETILMIRMPTASLVILRAAGQVLTLNQPL